MKKWIQITLSFAILLLGCKPDTSGQLSYEVPQELDDGILTGTLAEADMVLDPLTGALNDIRKGKFREIHSILIYRNNRLVFEEYFEGHKYQWNAPNHHAEWVKWDRDMLHHIMSDSKSITSACIGIAIDKGFIRGVDQSIFEYLPDYQRYKTESKEKITIEHLLTMTSGFDRDEWTSAYSNTSNPIIALWFSPSRIHCPAFYPHPWLIHLELISHIMGVLRSSSGRSSKMLPAWILTNSHNNTCLNPWELIQSTGQYVSLTT